MGVVYTGQWAFAQTPVVGGMGDGGRLSRKSALLLASITTGFPEEGTVTEQGMGTRKWLDRWGVGGSSQHMGPRGRKASGPGQGEGTQDSPWSRQHAGVGVGVQTGLRGEEVRPQRWGLWMGAAWEALAPSPRRPQHAKRLAQGRPLMAPHESQFLFSNQF